MKPSASAAKLLERLQGKLEEYSTKYEGLVDEAASVDRVPFFLRPRNVAGGQPVSLRPISPRPTSPRPMSPRRGDAAGLAVEWSRGEPGPAARVGATLTKIGEGDTALFVLYGGERWRDGSNRSRARARTPRASPHAHAPPCTPIPRLARRQRLWRTRAIGCAPLRPAYLSVGRCSRARHFPRRRGAAGAGGAHGLSHRPPPRRRLRRPHRGRSLGRAPCAHAAPCRGTLGEGLYAHVVVASARRGGAEPARAPRGR